MASFWATWNRAKGNWKNEDWDPNDDPTNPND
jgi:hypothetical protein